MANHPGRRRAKRTFIEIPAEIYEKLETLANKKGITVAELLKKGLKWEILFSEEADDPDTD